MSIAKRLFDVFRRRKGAPGDKGAVGTANDKRAADKTDFLHGKPTPQPTDSKSSASAKDEKLATESKRSIGVKESVDERLALESERSLKSQTERITDPTTTPWPALCYLQSHFQGASFKENINGTGFFISENVVITAAHNLCGYDQATRECIIPTTISVRPSNHKSASPIKCSPLNTRFAKQYEECLKADPFGNNKFHYDYGAILLLPGTIKPAPTFYFDVAGIEPEDPRWDKPLTCGGYFKDRSNSPIELYSTPGAATPKGDGRFLGEARNLVKHSARARGGQSGGPLFALDDNRVVGIQVWALPDDVDIFGAVRITGEMVELFKSWEREYRNNPAFRKDREDLIA